MSSVITYALVARSEGQYLSQMKTYEQALQLTGNHLGEQVYRNSMDGSYHPWHLVDVVGAADILAMIYNKDRDVVHRELAKRAEDHYNLHWPAK